MNRFLSICRFDNNGAWWGDADGSVLFSLIGVNSMFFVGSWISLVWMDWDCLGWLNENDNFKEGLGGIDLISGKIDLYFYDSNEDIVEEELKCAIMESNMNEVEKKIIRNIERIQEEEAKNFDRIIKNVNKTI